MSGFQEKAEFFEVYAGTPKFDRCSRTDAPLIDKEEYSPREEKLKAVVLRGNQLTVEYTTESSAAMEPDQARLTLVK